MSNTKLVPWRDRHWDAYLAHQAVGHAVRMGRLVPEPCAECGHEAAVAHHDNYAERLVVRWLCQQHHRLWHLAHPLPEVRGPERRAAPVAERTGPNRGRAFRRYLKPRAVRLRAAGATYQDIARVLGVSTSTAHEWCREP